MAEQENVQQDGATEAKELDQFEALLKKSFKPRNDGAASEVQNAVQSLVQQALQDTTLIKGDVIDTIDAMIAKLDQQLSIQLNEVIHTPEFQKLESAWRGLNYLVFNSETDTSLKIRVINVSKNELYREFKVYPGARWDQSPIFKKLYEAEYGQLGGDPYGCLVGDYYFDHSPTDVQLLRDISKVSAAAHAPSSPISFHARLSVCMCAKCVPHRIASAIARAPTSPIPL